MRAFNTAWALLKAPFVVYDDEGNKKEEWKGTLWSGGDYSDFEHGKKMYLTNNLGEAFAYSLFGSAIPFPGYEDMFARRGEEIGWKPPMRETEPRVLVVDGWGDEEIVLEEDPHATAYILPANWEEVDKPGLMSVMDTPKIKEMIRDAITDEQFWTRWGRGGVDATYGTTARHHDRDTINEHLKGALDRFNTGAGRLEIDPEAPYRSMLSTGYSDDITSWGEEQIENLETWQLQRLMNEYIAGSPPPYMTQEHVNELQRRLGFLAE